MHAHRIDVLHVAYGDARVRAVAHDLVFDLLPSKERSLDKHLHDWRGRHPTRHASRQLRGIVRDATPGAAESEGRTDDERVSNARCECERLLDRVGGDRFRDGLADREEKLFERLAVFGLLDRGEGRAEKSHSKALEYTGLGELHREVEAGLPAKRREEPARPLSFDDSLEDLDGKRLEVGDVRHAGVGHDRRGIGVDEDGLDAFLAERAASLRSGVVELRRLADENRPAPDDQDFHISSHPPPMKTQRPPTRTAVIAAPARSTSMSRMLGRPISNPCSTRMRVVDAACTSSWTTRYAPSGPWAEPVAGSSPMPRP